jgi:hypothetical protein
MIEQDIYSYLKQDTTLSGLLGGNTNVFLIQVPTTPPVAMPWVIVEVTSGSRAQITPTKMEEIAFARISVDAGPNQIFKGRAIMEQCKKALENYRGKMATAQDAHVSIGVIRGWAGFGGVYRYQFDATVRSIETYSQPNELV